MQKTKTVPFSREYVRNVLKGKITGKFLERSLGYDNGKIRYELVFRFDSKYFRTEYDVVLNSSGSPRNQMILNGTPDDLIPCEEVVPSKVDVDLFMKK